MVSLSPIAAGDSARSPGERGWSRSRGTGFRPIVREDRGIAELRSQLCGRAGCYARAVRVIDTSLPGVRVLAPAAHEDARGELRELFRDRALAAAGIAPVIRQVNLTRSVGGALRGLHWQLSPEQGKLVWVVRGRVFDVVADVRRDSDAFGRHVALELGTGDGVWIPPGFAHGFLAVGGDCDVVYALTEPYEERGQRGVRWDDPQLAIGWPIGAGEPILSVRDAALPLMRELGDEDLPDRR